MLLTRSAGASLSQQVYSILQKYGTDAHLYLPGIGVINGFTAGNYLDSAGTTAATVDNPVGLVLDAAGSVGSELVTNGDFSNGATGWTTSTGWTIANGVASAVNLAGGFALTSDFIFAANKSYLIAYTISNYTMGAVSWIHVGSGQAGIARSANGTYSEIVTSSAIGGFNLSRRTSNFTGDIDNISVKEVTGIHATQATTANKMILRRTNGRYWFDAVDGTDLLTTTYPAGYESVITIDAPSTGQVTLTAQNIVGTYNITTDTYGRFVFKTLTAGELTIMQTFANRLAGL
jgi:hypothetical protein